MKNEHKNQIFETFTENELKVYLQSRRILVASIQPTTAKAVRKLWIQFGAKPDNVVACFTYQAALNEMLTTPTHVLTTDISLDQESGFVLIAGHSQTFKNHTDTASILMCPEPSRNETGMILESNTDAVCLKPFNFENFKNAVNQALAHKVNPSAYWQTIENAKEQFLNQDLPKALELVKLAKTLDPQPILAYFYEAQIEFASSNHTAGISALKSALKLDPTHYRCLSLLMSAYMESSEYALAYQTASVLHETFPVSSTRLNDLIKLSIYERKYSDIADYAQIFDELKIIDEEITRTLISGLVISAKHSFMSKDLKSCENLLDQSLKFSLASGIHLTEVIKYAVEFKFFEKAYSFYAKIPESMKTSEEGSLLMLDILAGFGDPSKTIEECLKLFRTGIRTSQTYRYLISASQTLGRSPDTIQKLKDEAHSYFPDDFEA